ncbi:MAG: PEP-CTERM sorting domain-containing protein [Chthoniobacteraceae bacterium]
MHTSLSVRYRGTCTLALVLAATLSNALADNIAPEGFGAIGVNVAIDSNFGTPLEHAGVASNINDLNLNSSVDTFNGGGTETFSYVGVLYNAPRTDLIVSLTLNIAAFFDGGWFGPNNSGPGGTGTLNSTYLTEPTVQVTSDSGFTWVDIAATSDYVSALDGTVLPVDFGPATHANPATFTLSVPQTGIDGIRLIGSEGGTASGGFLGVFEMEVEAVPEPASAAALAFAGGLLMLRRSRRVAA